ncbi:MAG: fasciclin domain-containing protein [Pseudomonadota bacterium]
MTILRRIALATAVTLAAFAPIAAQAGSAKKASATKNIVETAKAAGKFNTLLKAASLAGLADALQADATYTVFAPDDAAFEKVPAKLMGKLTSGDYNDALTKLLKYHVVKGSAIEAAAVAGKKVEVETLSGGTLVVDGTGDGVTVNGAAVKVADIKASNGIIHVIDGVALPADFRGSFGSKAAF